MNPLAGTLLQLKNWHREVRDQDDSRLLGLIASAGETTDLSFPVQPRQTKRYYAAMTAMRELARRHGNAYVEAITSISQPTTRLDLLGDLLDYAPRA